MNKVIQVIIKEMKIIFRQEMRWQARKKLRNGFKKVLSKFNKKDK